ncbi:MAG: hypothetical protein JXR70_01870 [Spirochaetales bacterium]|nr:hypothetical protein [Spirochaetales bacterium]
MDLKAKKIILAALITLLGFMMTSAMAADVNVNLSSTKQIIKGFGGMTHPVWISDLTSAQVDTAFGNNDGQIGMTILRIHVDENSSNWSKEINTAKRAQSLGALVFASPWNPPSGQWTTVNGVKRINTSTFSQYANHLNSFVDYMTQNGVELYAISVQNEPDYAHEWTEWSATEIVNFLKAYGANIKTRVIAPESFQYRKQLSDPILNDAQALANMDILGAHLYGTQLNQFPYPLFKQKGQGKELWMTEVYTDSNTDADSWPNALEVAYNIHNSMVEAEFNAYVWWYIRRSYGMIKDNGNISKRGYCMSQFTKFIRPGFYRVDANKNPKSNVYVSAYKSGDKIVVVAVNRNSSNQSVSLALNGADLQTLTRYTTSGSKSMKNDGAVNISGGLFNLTLDSQSVTTFVGGFEEGTPVVTEAPTPFNTPMPENEAFYKGGPFSLNGSSDYYDLPDNLTASIDDFSITLRVTLNSVDTWTRLFDFGGNSDVFMMMTPSSGNTSKPYFCITTSGNDGEQGIDSSIAMTAGTEYHMAITKQGTTAILYINGEETGRNATMTLRPADLGSTSNNFLGRSQWENDPLLNGTITSFQFFNRALSAAEVTEDYNGTVVTPVPQGKKGDVNGDNVVNIVDALLVAQFYVGLPIEGTFIEANGDTNCDNVINIVDALLIAQYYVGLENSFC